MTDNLLTLDEPQADAPSLGGKPMFPAVFVLDNHRACNAACRMCPTQQQPIVDGEMPDEVFDAFVGQIGPRAAEIQQVLIGVHGEPLLDKKLESRVAKLVALGVRNVSINTNGSALTADRARKLVVAGTHDITIALDGHTAATFEAVRIGLKFDTVVRNAEQCLAIRNELGSSMRITLRLIIQSTNKHEIAAWSDHWRAKINATLDTLQVLPIHNWAYQKTLASGAGTTPCSSVFNAMVVSHDGTIPLCCLDHEPIYRLGNILDEPIETIFNGSRFKDIRDIHTSGKRNEMTLCNTCDRPETRALVEADDDFLKERERSFIWIRPTE